MSKCKVERPDLIQLKKRAIDGWGAQCSHVLWMVNMLEKAKGLIGNDSYFMWHETDNWHEEYDKANGT